MHSNFKAFDHIRVTLIPSQMHSLSFSSYVNLNRSSRRWKNRYFIQNWISLSKKSMYLWSDDNRNVHAIHFFKVKLGHTRNSGVQQTKKTDFFRIYIKEIHFRQQKWNTFRATCIQAFVGPEKEVHTTSSTENSFAINVQNEEKEK